VEFFEKIRQISAYVSIFQSTSSTFSSATSSNPGYVYALISTFTSTTIEISSVNGESAIVYFSSIPNPTSSLHIATVTINPVSNFQWKLHATASWNATQIA